ncbi:MAG: hypothetical protein JWO63_2463 [Frankiales bacterium]|nr:hypothetical protein [Frankiales bacterium]
MKSRTARLAALAAALLGCLALTACTGAGGSAPSGSGSAASASPSATGLGGADGESGLGGGDGEDSPTRSTIITTPTPSLSESVTAAEIDKPCPYASNDDFRAAEGDRTTHSVQLAGNPVGCRYFFAYDPSAVIGEITIEKFKDSTTAFNAVVEAAKGHPEFVDDKSIGDYGSISIKLPLQGALTWACIFSKGDLVVTAHTRQTVVGQDARNVAALIAPRIP